MLAAYHDQFGTVAMLLARGADPDLPNHRGRSIIAGALFKCADDVVRELVAAGADLGAGTPSAQEVACEAPSMARAVLSKSSCCCCGFMSRNRSPGCSE